MKTVSVIIPTFNRADLICEAIDSVLYQDFRDYELIVVDDGSTDSTKKKLKKYKDQITYEYQPHSGVSSARNKGIKISSSPYITFLDSDDKWEKRKLSTQINHFSENPDSLICYTSEKWIRNNIRVNSPIIYRPYVNPHFRTNQTVPHLLKRCFIGTSSVMLKRKLFHEIGYFDTNIPVCEDLDLWLRISLKHPMHFMNIPLTIKRMGNWNQLSRLYWGNDKYRIYILEKLLKKENLTPHYNHLFRKFIINKSLILAKGGLKHKNFHLTLTYASKWTINYLDYIHKKILYHE